MPTSNAIRQLRSYAISEVCSNFDMGKAFRIILGLADKRSNVLFNTISLDTS